MIDYVPDPSLTEAVPPQDPLANDSHEPLERFDLGLLHVGLDASVAGRRRWSLASGSDVAAVRVVVVIFVGKAVVRLDLFVAVVVLPRAEILPSTIPPSRPLLLSPLLLLLYPGPPPPQRGGGRGVPLGEGAWARDWSSISSPSKRKFRAHFRFLGRNEGSGAARRFYCRPRTPGPVGA